MLYNSIRDVESLIKRGMVSQTCGPLKRLLSAPYAAVSILGKEKFTEIDEKKKFHCNFKAAAELDKNLS